MRYEYSVTYRNYKDAQRLYRLYRWPAALSYYFWIWVVPITGFLLAVPMIAYILFGFRLDWLVTLKAFSGTGLWFALFIPAMRLHTLHRCWKRLLPDSVRRKSIKTPILVTFETTEEQVISTIPGQSEGRYFWSSLHDFAEDERIALIFIKKKQFIFIPKNALPENVWAEVRSQFDHSGIVT